MGIHLAHIHGQENVRILSCDNRLVKLVNKCRQPIPAETIKKLKLDRAEDIAGKKFSAQLFPKALHLGTCGIEELKEAFGKWPLDLNNHKKAYRHVR